MNPDTGIILVLVGLVGFLLVWVANIYRDRHYLWSLYVDWRCERARVWLLKNDSQYRMSYIGREIVRQREAARARNATADELDRIDHYSVAKSLGLENKL